MPIKKMRLTKTPISAYCDQFIRKEHATLSDKEQQRLRQCWDMATAKFMSLMQESAEVGMSQAETRMLMQQYKDEVLKRIMGKQHGQLG